MLPYLAMLIGFCMWGVFPIYFSYMRVLSVDEFMFARVVMSVVSFAIYFTFSRRWHRVLRDVLNRAMLLRCMVTTIFLATNWFAYIWAVQHDQTLQASLGYYITPIINVLFGFWLFAERMNRLQWAAVLCALAGVVYQVVALGVIPWASLIIAGAWSIYGGLHKKFHIAPVAGLFTELSLLMPLAVIGWVWLYASGQGFDYSTGSIGIFIGMLMTGLSTLIPLLLFLYAVHHLPISTVGITQYISPSIQFCIAIFFFNEPFDIHRLVSFILIWIALGLYSTHLISIAKDEKHA